MLNIAAYEWKVQTCEMWSLDMEISFVKCIFNSNCTKLILIKVMKAKMK